MQDLDQTTWGAKLSEDSNAIILDVRAPWEYEEGNIPGARNIDVQDAAGFMDAVGKLDASKNYYVYCRSGGRSARACMIMNAVGVPNTFNLIGGITEWQGAVTTN